MDSRIAVAFLVIGLLLALERWRPLRPVRYGLRGRWGVNLFFSLLTYGTAYVAVQPAIAQAFRLSHDHRFGLIPWLRQGLIPEILLSVFALDFTFYLWHRLNHRLPWLWRFHRVHHADPDLDVTTAFRFHFGEVALSSVFRFLQIFLLGVTPAVLAGYEIVFQIATFFHHGNVRLPVALEKALLKVVVTPRLHGLHHSEIATENHSNYSVIFSVWDRWCATATPAFPEHPVNIGLPDAQPIENAIIPATLTPLRYQKVPPTF